jgi:hypothetical protein
MPCGHYFGIMGTYVSFLSSGDSFYSFFPIYFSTVIFVFILLVLPDFCLELENGQSYYISPFSGLFFFFCKYNIGCSISGILFYSLATI